MSTPSSTEGLSRRELLLSSTAAALGMVMGPAQIWAATTEGTTKASASRPLLDYLCDAVIPNTRTPGARAAGVGAFVEVAAAHGMNGASAALLGQFAAALDELAGGVYLQQPEQRRLALLTDIDARSFRNAEDDTLPKALRQWPKLKGLIVIGYYTSQIGGSQELRYLPVPGRFVADVPLKPGDPAWSSDWTGVKYA